MKLTPRQLKDRRHIRTRAKIKGTSERPRLLVTRTLKHIHAQLVDDASGHTLTTASTTQGDIAQQVTEGSTGSRAAARVVGQVIAQRAKEKGIEAVVFDRNGNLYHGAVKELAEAAREAGLAF